MMVPRAKEKPLSMATTGDCPSRASSRMRSKMTTFESTAMPMVRMMPAMPGSVSVAPMRRLDAEHQDHVDDEREQREQAEQPVDRDHEDGDERRSR